MFICINSITSAPHWLFRLSFCIGIWIVFLKRSRSGYMCRSLLYRLQQIQSSKTPRCWNTFDLVHSISFSSPLLTFWAPFPYAIITYLDACDDSSIFVSLIYIYRCISVICGEMRGFVLTELSRTSLYTLSTPKI